MQQDHSSQLLGPNQAPYQVFRQRGSGRDHRGRSGFGGRKEQQQLQLVERRRLWRAIAQLVVVSVRRAGGESE